MAGITIIGVDCSAQAKNNGLVWASQDGDVLVVREARGASIEASRASGACALSAVAQMAHPALDHRSSRYRPMCRRLPP